VANATEIKFGDPATRIAQTTHWTLLLRPRQPTLGSVVLVCREPARAFPELSAAAFTDLREILRRLEPALRAVSECERVNYLMLMMVDRDVHFHVIPRYPGTRSILGVECRDAGWPGLPDLDAAVELDESGRAALIDRLRGAWSRASE
jgi:diadenosine tetraphosphate (Ap4A) HIT family hydrolase